MQVEDDAEQTWLFNEAINAFLFFVIIPIYF